MTEEQKTKYRMLQANRFAVQQNITKLIFGKYGQTKQSWQLVGEIEELFRIFENWLPDSYQEMGAIAKEIISGMGDSPENWVLIHKIKDMVATFDEKEKTRKAIEELKEMKDRKSERQSVRDAHREVLRERLSRLHNFSATENDVEDLPEIDLDELDEE